MRKDCTGFGCTMTYKPKFWPQGWRQVKLDEPLLEGDYYWSPSRRYWIAITDFDNEFPRYLPVIRRYGHAEEAFPMRQSVAQRIVRRLADAATSSSLSRRFGSS